MGLRRAASKNPPSYDQRAATADYYRERAPRYDLLHRTAEWQTDFAKLKHWVAGRTAGRRVLEVAAGTGFWTAAAAPRATAIVATDYNPETLALARKRSLGRHVTLLAADAYALPKFACAFDVGMAHLWWSHVDKRGEQRFLEHFASRLQPGAELLMIDQLYLEGYSMPAFRRDRAGNRYELRSLESGRVFQVIKNYPAPEQLKASLAVICEEVQVTSLRYFWALRARLRE
jgi:demethylmenaquinone methyltransferase/2-methoxy-6-polyprenyl-1,4-benzoquinol methylase